MPDLHLMPDSPPVDWSARRAGLFDLDGVLTPTAALHRRAWREMFEDYFASMPGVAPYTEQDYFEHLDGRPRFDGVREVLASRGISLPDGQPEDTADRLTIHGLGNRKNLVFAELLARDGVEPYPGAEELLERLHELGVRTAVVSSSRNARQVLVAAGLLEHFELLVDGEVAAAHHLAGKPAPDTFRYAAERLGVPVELCVVVEDAASGVQAGRDGGFGTVVGVDRGAGAAALLAAGADVVITSLEELLP
jgi:beta-phosphoglucomutase family hydrolase